jgi:hypothetical protein
MKEEPEKYQSIQDVPLSGDEQFDFRVYIQHDIIQLLRKDKQMVEDLAQFKLYMSEAKKIPAKLIKLNWYSSGLKENQQSWLNIRDNQITEIFERLEKLNESVYEGVYALQLEHPYPTDYTPSPID